jgi:hypothetical protein
VASRAALRERWRGLREWQRRALKALVVVLLGLLILGPIYGFTGSAFLVVLVVIV